MIFSWTPETEMVHSASHQPDLGAEEALNALDDLSSLMLGLGSGSFQAVISVFSFIVRLGRIPIRRHEDALLRSIHDRVLLKHEPADYNSPYFKIFLLLQAHFSRLPLSPDLAADLAIVLERVFSLFSVCAHRNWFNFDSDLAGSTLQILHLMRMCVHGMWNHDSELKQIPHFADDVSCSIRRWGLWLIHASGY
jgi:pre-mRNA-splicing helicase BRR2